MTGLRSLISFIQEAGAGSAHYGASLYIPERRDKIEKDHEIKISRRLRVIHYAYAMSEIKVVASSKSARREYHLPLTKEVYGVAHLNFERAKSGGLTVLGGIITCNNKNVDQEEGKGLREFHQQWHHPVAVVKKEENRNENSKKVRLRIVETVTLKRVVGER
ncbi:hypothetical protein Tco_0602563 [Tanacetum coccineum]